MSSAPMLHIASLHKPKHPLSAYNMFFQLQRQRILDGTDLSRLPITYQELQHICAKYKMKQGKRLHRKSHGKIGFCELARTVARRWKNLDPETRKTLEHQAAFEKEEWAIQHKMWKLNQEDNKAQALPQDQNISAESKLSTISFQTNNFEGVRCLPATWEMANIAPAASSHSSNCNIDSNVALLPISSEDDSFASATMLQDDIQMWEVSFFSLFHDHQDDQCSNWDSSCSQSYGLFHSIKSQHGSSAQTETKLINSYSTRTAFEEKDCNNAGSFLRTHSLLDIISSLSPIGDRKSVV